jgi:hypothetical protein
MTERPSEKAAWPKSEEELLAYLREMAEWPEGASEPGEAYGRCAYAVAYAALATFNYMSSVLGITGFQASCADMEILAQSRGMKHGFMILDADKLLYPQYDVLGDVLKWTAETKAQLADAAAKNLAEAPDAHPDVVRHWKELAHAGT